MSSPQVAQDSIKVAITRERGSNKAIGKLLAAKNITTVEIPCLEFVGGQDLLELTEALQEKTFDYTIITSPEAAKVFIARWKASGVRPVPVACVGPGTEKILKEGGIRPVFMPSKANGATLAAELPVPKGPGPHTVLYPASAKAADTIETELKKRGFEVTRLNSYDTVPSRWNDELYRRSKDVQVVAFGSPSAVLSWGRKASIEGRLAACIGNTTAVACGRAGWREESVFSAENPGLPGWADAVERAVMALRSKSTSVDPPSGTD